MGTVSPSDSKPASTLPPIPLFNFNRASPLPPVPPLNFNPLDPEIEKMLDPAFVEHYKQKIDIKPAMHQHPLKEVRLNPKAFIPPWQVKTLPNVRISDSSLTRRRIPIRIYEPDPEKFGLGPYGVHINFHGTVVGIKCPKMQMLT
jgi:hypothetical protein